MDRARREAAAGRTYEVITPQGVFVFYNNPRPFCYTYSIPGEWVAAAGSGAFRSKDGRAFAGVLFVLAGHLSSIQGATLVERAGNGVTKEYEKRVGQPLAGVELMPFDSSRAGTWRWQAAPVTQGNRQVALPPKVIVDLSPHGVAQITVAGTSDDDRLLRQILETLRTTSDPACYWSTLENMLKAALGSS
jgi:hypothetical protein